MSNAPLLRELDELTRVAPQSSDPRFKLVLRKLLFHTNDLRRSHPDVATEFFRDTANSILRLRGGANIDNRLELLFQCCEHLFLSGSVVETERLATQSVTIASRYKRPSYLRKFFNILALTANESGDRGRSVEWHAQALSLALEQFDLQGTHSAWSNLSAVFVDSGMYRESIACATKALEFIEQSDPGYQDHRARSLNNTALACYFLGERERALKFARDCVKSSCSPETHTSAIARMVRELNLVMILVSNREFREAKEHSEYMKRLAARFPSARADAATKLADGITEVFVGDCQKGLKQLEATAAGLRGTMVPLYLDALSILVQVFSSIERPEDALRVLRERIEYTGPAISSSLTRQLQSLGFESESLTLRQRQNRQEAYNTELELRTKIAEKELQQSQQEMLERMAVTADIKEDISGEHGYRVGRLSALLAKEIGWERDACNAMDIAARLHDIGKFGIADKILLDERTLRKAERDFIAMHTTLGAEILSKSDIPQVRLAEEIAHCHHEWWDGNGYPRRLKGNAIPRSARIVALADSFDAMTHGRPYAMPISIESAMNQISSLRGQQFDPELADSFLALLGRLTSENADLDIFLNMAARHSPFLRARAKIKELLLTGAKSSENSTEGS